MSNYSSTSILKSSSGLLSPVISQFVLILRIAPTHVQDLALGLVELGEIHTDPLLKPVTVPLDGILSFRVASAPLSLVSSANVLRARSMLLSM